jgi:hypothetical protein
MKVEKILSTLSYRKPKLWQNIWVIFGINFSFFWRFRDLQKEKFGG